MLFDEYTGFYNIDQYVDQAYMDLTSNTGKYDITFPISFLEDSLGGMLKSELMVIGADTGCGKSDLSNQIAFHNAARGKSVFMFSLEGDKYDFINRKKYTEYIKLIKGDFSVGSYCTYRDFLINKIPREDLLKEIDENLKKDLKNIKVYARENDLTIKRFEEHLKLINGTADLIIIDHLHYFEFGDKEYDSLNEIMKRLKKKQNEYRIPIILVSHLRKKDKNRVFPETDDFHGSSNITKQADIVLLLAHIDTGEDSMEVFRTGMRVAKSRTGFPTKIIGALDYNLKKRAYSTIYKIMVYNNNYLTYFKGGLPDWAKNGEIHIGREDDPDTLFDS